MRALGLPVPDAVLGATATTVHPLATAEEYAEQLRDSSARRTTTGRGHQKETTPP
ncbi:hypothetical protein [Streptomyces gelaticus]|uniref:hypothetical protein n=1 Tax=Streptomyces gelaticus TaxID=285446 RepID=UPI001679F845|nr:hypothetical protein [Streptomyces gelaticus]